MDVGTIAGSAADDAQVRAAVGHVCEVLGDAVVGVLLHGSAVGAGLQRYSDLDLLVVVGRSTTGEERAQLLSSLLALSRPFTGPDGRPLEVTVVRQDLLRPWPDRPAHELLFGEWLRAEYEAGAVPDPEDDPDLAPLVATAFSGSLPLLGPAIEQLLDPPPRSALVAVMRRCVPSLLADLDTDTNVLLTLARMVTTARDGRIVSNAAEAATLEAEMPGHLVAPLRAAREWYLGITPGTAGAPGERRATAEWLLAAFDAADRPPRHLVT